MNPVDDHLERLFRAAGKVHPEGAAELAFGLETRVLAAWRASRSTRGSLWDMTLLVRGLIVASVIMAASFLPAINGTGTTSGTTEASANPYSDFVQLADSTASSDEEQ